MTEEERLRVRIEQIIGDPTKSKKVLFEINQYFGKQLFEASIKKEKNGSTQ